MEKMKMHTPNFTDEKQDYGVLRGGGLQGLIHTFRGMQVMFDRDLAELYGVPVKRLNEQVKRNEDRFPEPFRFQLTREELEAGALRSQIATLENGRGKHRKYMPYVFTEQGVAMLSAVLRSETAVKTSVSIMNAFVGMRRFLMVEGGLIQRMDSLEKRQVMEETKTEKRFEKVFKALEHKSSKPVQGVFFDGQVFDAYRFINDLIRQAKKTIVLVDNYVDDTVLEQLSKRREGVSATIFTKTITKRLALDLKKHNEQYSAILIHTLSESHDRFLMIDDDVYHIGASMKDLGKRWFAFSKMDQTGLKVVEKIRDHEAVAEESE